MRPRRPGRRCGHLGLLSDCQSMAVRQHLQVIMTAIDWQKVTVTVCRQLEGSVPVPRRRARAESLNVTSPPEIGPKKKKEKNVFVFQGFCISGFCLSSFCISAPYRYAPTVHATVA
jgi:hypothetical protein